MKLIDPIMGGTVETFTESATAHLMANGYKPLEAEKPKKAARKRTTKPKEQ